MSKKNPYSVIRSVAAGIGYTVLIALAVFLFGGGLIHAVKENGPSFLWQVPLTLGVTFGVLYLIFWICSKVADYWNKAEYQWDKRNRENEEV